MKLTNIDYQNIANLIEVGSDTIEYAKDGETLFIDYTYETDGYVEDDYFNGTGAYVAVERVLEVQAIDCLSGDGEASQSDFCEFQLLKYVA